LGRRKKLKKVLHAEMQSYLALMKLGFYWAIQSNFFATNFLTSNYGQLTRGIVLKITSWLL
jgi:hypothetical protein